MLKAISIFLLFLGGALVTFSCGNQTASAPESKINIPEKEQELIRIDEKMMELYYGDPDSMLYYSNLFSSKLEELLSDEKTLSYAFNALTKANSCRVNTSKDGLFRIYSWDSNLGGTMRAFNVVYQYQNGKIVKTQRYHSEMEGDPAWYCSDLFTLKTKKNTVYLAITNGIYSSKDIGQSIRAFKLTEKGLNDSIPLFKTKEGIKNSLDAYYDFSSVIDRPERPVSIIRYDVKKKQITLACVSDEEKVLPNCYTIYQFNGTHFEETGRKIR